MTEVSDWIAVSAFTTEMRAEEAKLYLENVGMEVRLESAPAEDLLEMVEGEWVVWVKGEEAERAKRLLEMEFQLAHKRGILRSPQDSPPAKRRRKAKKPSFEEPVFEVEVVEQGDDDLWISADDKRVDRAFRVAIAGLIIWPLEFYSLALSIENGMNWQRIGGDRYGKAIASGVISVLMCWFMVTLIFQWLR